MSNISILLQNLQENSLKTCSLKWKTVNIQKYKKLNSDLLDLLLKYTMDLLINYT